MTAAAPALTSELIRIPAQRGPVDQIDTLDTATTARRAGTVYALLNAILASVILLLAAPVLIAVKLDDGPVFFRQVRVGEDGREFSMIKFRSMVVDAEAKVAALMAQNEGAGPPFKMVRDPRITRVEQFIRNFGLDELAQLFNVAGSTMALVGPRPALPREVAVYDALALCRLTAKPVLTGL